MRSKKRALLMVLLVLIAALAVFALVAAAQISQIPKEILLVGGRSQTIDLSLPFSIHADEEAQGVIEINGNSLKEINGASVSRPVTITSEREGTANISFDLFGIFPAGSTKVTVVDETVLIPGGQSIGVMLYTDGALVVGSMEFESENGTVDPASRAGLRAGDVIIRFNGQKLENARHLSDLINEVGEGPVRLTIRRGEGEEELQITPERDSADGKLKLGVWVRDSTAGVGTLTFYDPQTHGFAGLGHAISDVDTGSLLEVKEGEIVSSSIIEIVKGEAGEPGALRGSFATDNEVIGHIAKNTEFGIYGSANRPLTDGLYPGGLPTAKRDEVKTGPASILCTLDGGGTAEYSCQITRVSRQDAPAQKSLELTIDDPKLLALTGGIVQGMSGSPILQNGKIVGAVTHVFVSDPTKGYGIYIDWMLNEMREY